MIPGSQHRHRARRQSWQPIAKRLRRPFTGQAQQQGDLHVCRLAARGQVHRRGVLVPVHEHEGCPASDVTQRRNSGEQHRAISAVHEREPASRQRGAHPAVQRVDHLQQRPLVEQSRADGALSDWAGKHQIRLHGHIRAKYRRQARGAQCLRRTGLARGTAHAVERHPDHVDQRPARYIPGGRRFPHRVLPAIAGQLERAAAVVSDPTKPRPAPSSERISATRPAGKLTPSWPYGAAWRGWPCRSWSAAGSRAARAAAAGPALPGWRRRAGPGRRTAPRSGAR